MDKYFYISGSGGQCGPVTEEKLKDLRQRRVISEKTPLWCEGMKDWQPYGEVFSIWSKSSFDKHHNVAWLVAGGLASGCILVYLLTGFISQKKSEMEAAERRREQQSQKDYYEMKEWLESQHLQGLNRGGY